MTSIKDAAKEFEPSTLKNISDLDMVSSNVSIQEETKEAMDGTKYTYKFIELEGVKYRVPLTVLDNLKAILEKKPELKNFAVSRTGTTKEDTRYTVIPLD